MIYKFVSLVSIVLVLASFHYRGPGGIPEQVRKAYHQADALFHLSNSTPATDSEAIAGFEKVVAAMEGSEDAAGRDTLLFQCWLKKGMLLDSRLDYGAAKNAYGRALSYHSRPDSLTFVAMVYAGASYYNLNDFDSANYFLLKAESMIGLSRDQYEEVRLYNTLGVLYYDNGNYRQGKNYFMHALEIVNGQKPFDTMSAVSLQANIATSFYRLGEYEEALSIYKKILPYGMLPDVIHMNMGRAYAGLERYREAMVSFRKVNAAKVPGVWNEMGHTQLRMHRPDSSAWFLDQLSSRTGSGKVNELDLGINNLYRADMLSDQHRFLQCLQSLQRAVIIFSRNFSSTDIYANPSSFTGTFAYYRLFDALLKKAMVFGDLYREDPKPAYLEASYQAYRASLSILRYIEQSYDTDDAKLFLKKRNGEAYKGALGVCMQLYALHPREGLLQAAFEIAEKNKASIISASLKERTTVPGSDTALLQRERNIKYNIARLNVQSDEAADSKVIERITRDRTGYEIDLARLRKELERNSRYYKLKYEDSVPGIEELQQHLDGDQALISFSATEDALFVYALTRSSFTYTRIDSLALLQKAAGSWLTNLRSMENGRKFRGEALGAELYRRLIQPVQAMVPKKTEWTIVPDGFLYFLPFESLPASAGSDAKLLLESTTISYQFSARSLLNPMTTAAKGDPGSGMVLAFAPFAGGGAEIVQPFPATGATVFGPLPASRAEIEGEKGASYIGQLATKQEFLRQVNRYPVVHLATHAVSSLTNAAASFVAFYPGKGPAIENNLYLEELYGLNLDSTRLVIISACETGQGELVSSEGVISLARAFAYAGCESTVNSLWKADDQATSFILRAFHRYLREGASRSKALQKAKLDYLASDAINKSPAYWAHLVLIGNTEPVYPSGWRAAIREFAWGIVLLLLGGVVWMALRWRADRRNRRG